jgi:hypothetical protein
VHLMKPKTHPLVERELWMSIWERPDRVRCSSSRYQRQGKRMIISAASG